MKRLLTLPILLSLAAAFPATAGAQSSGSNVDPSLEAFVQGFKGLGANLADDSKPLAPEETLKHFKIAPGLKMEVIAHEPAISQPVNLHFDERGRMWVVEYRQYPFPAGLKIVKYDEHLRAVFDKAPPPPPNHFKGRGSNGVSFGNSLISQTSMFSFHALARAKFQSRPHCHCLSPA